MSDSLWPRGLQHTRLLCPPPFPWRLLKLMSIESVMPPNHLILCCPLLLLPSIFPSIREWCWPMSWLFLSGGQITGASVSASLLPMNIQDWFPLQLTGLILHFKDSQESSPALQFKSIIPQCSTVFMVQLSDPSMTTGKTIALTEWAVSGIWCLCFSTLSRWLQPWN